MASLLLFACSTSLVPSLYCLLALLLWAADASSVSGIKGFNSYFVHIVHQTAWTGWIIEVRFIGINHIPSPPNVMIGIISPFCKILKSCWPDSWSERPCVHVAEVCKASTLHLKGIEGAAAEAGGSWLFQPSSSVRTFLADWQNKERSSSTHVGDTDITSCCYSQPSNLRRSWTRLLATTASLTR